MIASFAKCIKLPKINKVLNLSFGKQIIVKANIKIISRLKRERIFHVQIPIRCNQKFDHSDIRILLIIRVFECS